MKLLRNFFLCACVLLLVPSCNDSDDGNLVNGIVRNYDGLDLSSCGWVIEIQNNDGTIEVLLPLNLDPLYEQNNLFVALSYNETMGSTTCTANAVFIECTDIIINQIQ